MDTRRVFLKKTAGLLPLTVIPAQGVFAAYGVTDKLENMKTTKAVLKTRPLGFQWETRDPFIFCVHHEDFFPAGNDLLGPMAGLEGRQLGNDFVVKDGWRMYHGKKVPGFPGHPHVGFETITVVREGFVDHSDSLGAAGRYGNGDVQWMTAGKGVQHSEMFPLLKQDGPNKLQLFQIWLNLPASGKKAEPHFKMLWSEKVPRFTETDANGKATEVEVMVGTFKNRRSQDAPPASWAANADNDVAVYTLKLAPGAVFTLPATPKGVDRSIYLYKGYSIDVSGEKLKGYHVADLADKMDIELVNSDAISEILVMQGRPINEPVVQHGPFVGNSRNDIQQAFLEYNKTQFGGWPWPEFEYVHPKEKGRFALYPDGRKETPE